MTSNMVLKKGIYSFSKLNEHKGNVSDQKFYTHIGISPSSHLY